MSIEARLAELGIILPKASTPAAMYSNVVQVDTLLFVAGKGASHYQGEPLKGKLGREYTTREGYQFARLAGIEILAVLHEAYGLEQIQRVVKLQGFVNATEDFEEHHKVMDGCSELMFEVFEERGAHARSVLGAVSLRGNLPIVVDSIFELK
jgi:enamine deaminase RidA (YjgF/YER057c/UK114 family)